MLVDSIGETPPYDPAILNWLTDQRYIDLAPTLSLSNKHQQLNRREPVSKSYLMLEG